MRGNRRAKGQVTVEYMLVLVAVLLAVIFAIKTILQPKVETQFKQSGELMGKASNEFNNMLFP